MSPTVTIDASVFVSAFTPSEPAHQASKAFMSRVREESLSIIVPVLVLPEISAAFSRGQSNPELGMAFVKELQDFPNTTFIDVDDSLANLASEVAAKYRLRVSDAVYAAVALRFGTELITLDKEQLERLPKVAPVRAPK
ncbi:MAG: tRNA(fMet)-specific endonuclease VapC [Anaerolineales bacterium]|nr:tRNA(fMet)-specific endonuclease VapC [Anaerolineales bacterium]WKZ46803.1 MAG: type II toxin-antitoxin system VapC family toxin [Anaerolineales bacterium]